MEKYPFLEPEAKKAIDMASKQNKTEECYIIMMVEGFQTPEEALILKDLLWYASDKGVTVHIIPGSRR